MKILLASALLLFSVTLNANTEIDITYFISDKSSAPIQIPSQNSGIVTDVLEMLDMPNVNLHYQVLPFPRMILMLERSETPWITYGSAQWKDARSNDLSATPLLTVRHVLMTKAETPYVSFDEILDKGIVLIRGFNYPGMEDYIDNKTNKIFYVKKHESAIKMVQKGRVAAFVGMHSRLKYHIKKLSIEKDTFALHDFSNIIWDYDVNMSFSKNFPKAYKNSIEKQLINFKHTGQLEAILKKYQ